MTDQPKRRGRPPKVRPLPPMTRDEAHVEALTATDAWPAGSAKAWADDPWSAVRQMGDPYPLGRYRFKSGTLQQAWQHNNGVQWRPLPIVPADAPDWEDA